MADRTKDASAGEGLMPVGWVADTRAEVDRMSIDGAPLHQVLFRLAARAPGLTLEGLMQRMVTGIANHYAAVACSIHTDARAFESASK